MFTARLAIATTSLLGDAVSEKGFDGSGTVENSPGRDRSWRWSVESHDADISRLCDAENRMLRTPAACVERTVCAPLDKSILRTSQSKPALKASLSSRPKHVSSTGARCSNFCRSLPPGSACVS
jgi:hypothetical protein